MRATTQVSKHEPRREPQQIRSQRRVEKILDAATQIFVESGFEAATTNAIAERAEVSIGSVYQFFPNKAAMLIQINLRCLEDSRATLDAVFIPELLALTREEMIERVIDALRDFQSRNSGVLRVLTTTRLPELFDPAYTVSAEACRHVERLLEIVYPNLTPERRATIAAVCFATTDAVFHLASTQDTNAQAHLLDEVKVLLKAYIGTLE